MTTGESPTKASPSGVRPAVGSNSTNNGVGVVGGGHAITKQWWKVCFLYGGNQEKYYRQIYGKAASERLAAASAKQLAVSEVAAGTGGPTKKASPSVGHYQASPPPASSCALSSPVSVVSTLTHDDGFRFRKGSPVIKSASSRSNLAMPCTVTVGSNGTAARLDHSQEPPPVIPAGILRKRVTVLDESFLLGNGSSIEGELLEVEADEQRSDSGINVDARQPSPQNELDDHQQQQQQQRQHYRLECHRPGMRRTFHLSGEELRLLNFDQPCGDDVSEGQLLPFNGTLASHQQQQQISAASNPSSSSSPPSSSSSSSSSFANHPVCPNTSGKEGGGGEGRSGSLAAASTSTTNGTPAIVRASPNNNE